ncbi:hypothetical protein F3W84_22425 [Ochrobactrum quorumnocens]|uniref:Alpha/beta-hydrolase catalytic domain-containing protein n=1 Tax=Ochrobactrum quorumnocens TaxID=271865 RepID=A0A5N1JMM6_9HYPH|nr:hypothetical protein F3W84_22425 [[Ochrobactrum] quorumnocens]
MTNNRDAGSTEWLPVFQKGRFVRFMNENGTPQGNTAQWGYTRFVYLQLARDAITFFDKSNPIKGSSALATDYPPRTAMVK